MAVSPQYARTMLGQWVECHSAYGIHSGILQEVRPDGIVLGIPQGNMAQFAHGQEKQIAEYANNPTECKIDNIFSPFFFRRLFIPFFLLFLLTRRRFF